MSEIPQDSSVASPGAAVEDVEVVVIGAGISGIGAAHRIAEQIREYLTATAHEHEIDEHIRLNTEVRSANWDSATDVWTVQGPLLDLESRYAVPRAPDARNSGPWKVRQNYLTDVIAHRFGRIDDAMVFATT
jgi:hypothetical protein